MENKKLYYNKGLETILNTYITKEKYGEFAIIVQEIFQRRAYEFDFKNDQMIEEIQNFSKNVNSINYVSEEEMSKKTVWGTYTPSQEKIKLNEDVFNKLKDDINLGEKLFETLTHEVYHAISDNKEKGRTGLTYFDMSSGTYRGTALNEICTEVAADRASISRTSNDMENGRRNTSGYADITFVANLLSASLGLTEKEFLAAGVQNRGKLSEVIFSKFPQNDINSLKQLKTQILDSLELNLDILYNLNYNQENNVIDNDLKKSLRTDALSSIYIKAYELANVQIDNDSREISKELSSELIYRFEKMEKIIEDSSNHFNKYGIINKEQVDDNIFYIRNCVLKKINGVELLENQGYKIEDKKVLEEQFEIAKRGDLYKENNLKLLKEKYGVDLNYKSKQKEIDDSSYKSYILKEDFDNFQEWNNGPIEILMKRNLEKHLKSVNKFNVINFQNEEKNNNKIEKTEEKIGFLGKVRNNIRDIISRFKNRNLKQLPPVEELVDETASETNKISVHEAWAKQYEVSKEELIPMEEVLKQNSEKSINLSKDENIIE